MSSTNMIAVEIKRPGRPHDAPTCACGPCTEFDLTTPAWERAERLANPLLIHMEFTVRTALRCEEIQPIIDRLQEKWQEELQGEIGLMEIDADSIQKIGGEYVYHDEVNTPQLNRERFEAGLAKLGSETPFDPPTAIFLFPDSNNNMVPVQCYGFCDPNARPVFMTDDGTVSFDDASGTRPKIGYEVAQ